MRVQVLPNLPMSKIDKKRAKLLSEIEYQRNLLKDSLKSKKNGAQEIDLNKVAAKVAALAEQLRTIS